MKQWLLRLLLASLAVFAPVQSALIVIFVLIVLDFITGIMAAKKQNILITSNGMKKTVIKLMLYELLVCITFLIQHYLTGDIFPALSVVNALIGITELKSLLENINIITGNDILKILISKLNSAEDNEKQ